MSVFSQLFPWSPICPLAHRLIPPCYWQQQKCFRAPCGFNVKQWCQSNPEVTKSEQEKAHPLSLSLWQLTSGHKHIVNRWGVSCQLDPFFAPASRSIETIISRSQSICCISCCGSRTPSIYFSIFRKMTAQQPKMSTFAFEQQHDADEHNYCCFWCCRTHVHIVCQQNPFTFPLSKSLPGCSSDCLHWTDSFHPCCHQCFYQFRLHSRLLARRGWSHELWTNKDIYPQIAVIHGAMYVLILVAQKRNDPAFYMPYLIVVVSKIKSKFISLKGIGLVLEIALWFILVLGMLNVDKSALKTFNRGHHESLTKQGKCKYPICTIYPQNCVLFWALASWRICLPGSWICGCTVSSTVPICSWNVKSPTMDSPKCRLSDAIPCIPFPPWPFKWPFPF